MTKGRYPTLPVTEELRERLRVALAPHGEKKKLAEAIGASPSLVTKLVRKDDRQILVSALVQPICEYYGWALPLVAVETDTDMELLRAYRKLDPGSRDAVLALVRQMSRSSDADNDSD